ncbi:SPOR domain-containing protein [uncultured Tateyamaria sp.]|uniref:SPOR domain-containing protein n=1 Tax=uncultured Tateyamaria sp. TaxID=455651 RepID=UPI002627A4E7|nr:SPOR domain-containing protein [uncultured Tateyamaria sp.]
MSFTRIAAIAVIAASVFIGASHAQNLRSAQTPAEFPPASFKGTQYVDSRGCVFIRAGIDGNVTWVPRVNRQRQLICGQTPTLSANAAAAARSTPRQTTQGSPEQITIDAPTAQTNVAPAPVQTPAPQPTARTAQTVQPAPAVTVRRPAASPVRPVAPAPTQQRTATAEQAVPACDGRTAVSSRYINSGQTRAVRCGPQSVSPTTAPVAAAQAPVPVAPVRPAPTRTVAATAPEARIAGPQTRVVPRHVFENRSLKRPSKVPEGYVPVWEDDRLNPRRAEQSLNGIALTRLAWTATVPRRLIDRSTGRDMTARVPLVFPYTDIDTQERNLGTVTLVRRDGKIMKRVQRKSRAKARQPVVSTRSAPKPVVKTAPRKSPEATTKGQYVQVGTFGVPANAQAAAQRVARAGLPARIGKVKRGGKSYQIVLAGPFASSADLSNGLQRSRAVGFSDAFVRK